MIEVLRNPAEMRSRAGALRAAGKRISFVPTMGYLHAGHVSLMEAARDLGDARVLSIFVNPTQFGPKEDLSRYPRDLDGDLHKAEGAGITLAFVPEAAAIYPDGYQTFVEVSDLSQGMCGASRPGHFSGVATIVLKLFHLVQPHVALFGEKDFQQLAVLKRMARDLDLDVEVRGLPIVRESDGLAMSSRNAYLSAEQRQDALILSRAIFGSRDRFVKGERSAEALLALAREILMSNKNIRLDYLELRDAESLKTVDGNVGRPTVLAVAAFVGSTRLIDNVVLPA